jgi:hypothetical protein
MRLLFEAIEDHGIDKAEQAITARNLHRCDYKVTEFVRQRYLEAFGEKVQPDKVALLDTWLRSRQQQSAKYRPSPKPRPDIAILFEGNKENRR